MCYSTVFDSGWRIGGNVIETCVVWNVKVDRYLQMVYLIPYSLFEEHHEKYWY